MTTLNYSYDRGKDILSIYGTPGSGDKLYTIDGITYRWASCFDEFLSWRVLVRIDVHHASSYWNTPDDLVRKIRSETNKWSARSISAVLSQWNRGTPPSSVKEKVAQPAVPRPNFFRYILDYFKGPRT